MKKWLVDGAGSILAAPLSTGWAASRGRMERTATLLPGGEQTGEERGKRQVERGGGGAALKSNGKFISLMSHIEHCRIV